MFDYEWATVQHTVNCRLAQTVVVPDAIPPERLARYGATRQDRRLRGPEGGVLPRRLRARPGGARRARPRPRRADRGHPHAAGGLAVSPLRERRPRRRARPPAAARRPSSCRARPNSVSELRGGGFVVPEQAIDAQSLIAYADLVVSAGGTMNREAVALGTPVWTTFQGRLGAVDERLIAEGRLRTLRARRGRHARQARPAGARRRAHPARPGRARGAAGAPRWRPRLAALAAGRRACSWVPAETADLRASRDAPHKNLKIVPRVF